MSMSRKERKNNANQQEARESSIVGFEERQFVINNCAYFVHSIYNLYAASRDGKIIHIVKQVPDIGNKKSDGYMKCTVRKYGAKNQKTHPVHRFVWECFHGVIPDGKVIDHISDNKEDNRLSNLQLMTQQKN